MIFDHKAQELFYQLIKSRRDIRSNFSSDSIPKNILEKIIEAAHHAPSVGFLQPWDFIIIDSLKIRQKIKANFEQARNKESMYLKGEKLALYDSLKLEGILESPINICVTCDRTKDPANILGQTAQPNMDLYSTVCAIQNMWLAARVENIGMGWVSILDQKSLRETLKIPENIEIVGYFCLGFVEKFSENPELESKGWKKREAAMIHKNTWARS